MFFKSVNGKSQYSYHRPARHLHHRYPVVHPPHKPQDQLSKMKHRKYKLLIIALLLIFAALLTITIIARLNNNSPFASSSWHELVYHRIFPRHSHASRMPCASNLWTLSNALVVYAANHQDNLPPAEKWCDVLMAEPGITHNHFICARSNAKKGQSSYTLNKHIIGRNLDELSPNTVILFESKPGWNQIGGAELLTPENHRLHPGSNVMLNNGKIRWYKTTDFNQLNWNIPPEQNE